MLRYFTFCFSLLFIFSVSIQAQHIKRKGKLGVQLDKAEANPWNAPYRIKTVFPNSTAADLQMKVSDVVVEINGQAFNSGPSIQKIIAQFIADSPVEAKVARNGQLITLNGKVIAPPLQAHNEAAEVLVGEVAFRKGYIRSLINKPKGKGPFKTIYYIQGYPCQSFDVGFPHPKMQLIQAWVDLGYAVYRVEKPGVGEFYNCGPCQEYSFDDEVEAFGNGYRNLMDQDFVDKEQIYLFGHSLGGNVAPILAKQFKPAGVMVYGTLIKPWEDYMVDMARYSQPLSEADVTVPESKISFLKEILHKIYQEDRSLSSLNPEEKALLANWHDMKEDKYLFQRNVMFWKNFAQHNFVAHWNEINVPVLSMYGSTDVHAISGLDAEFIATIVNKNHPGKATYKLVDKTDHIFAKVDSKLEEIEYINEGSLLQVGASKFNQEFPKLVHDWITELDQKEKNQHYLLANKLLPQSLTKMSTMDVESADLDQDGYKDLILATEFGPNRIFFYTENGFAEDEQRRLPALKTYQPPFQGEDSEDIAVADFNRDGKPDLFFVSEDTDAHELYINKGNGAFALADLQIPKKGEANAVLIYDFNQDNYPDVLIGIRGRNELYINQKGKGFKEASDQFWTNNEDHTQDLILVDVDADGDLDILEGIEVGENNLYLNTKGTFKEESQRLPALTDIETRKIGAFDADGDGDQDLFLCNVGWTQGRNPQNIILLNDGKGNFKPAEKAISEDLSTTLDVIFLDLNKDGKTDVLTTGMSNTGNLKAFVNRSENGQLRFEEDNSVLPPGSYGSGIAMIADDFKGDGKIGVYLGNYKYKDFLLMEK